MNSTLPSGSPDPYSDHSGSSNRKSCMSTVTGDVNGGSSGAVGGTSMTATGNSSSPNRMSSLRNATLARQPSFDHGGEGRLSSTQVKQRLKTYLLNRRRQSGGSLNVGAVVASNSGRHRRGPEDRLGALAATQQLTGSHGSDSTAGSISHRGGSALWDSSDSTHSFDSTDWNEMVPPGGGAGGGGGTERSFQPFCSLNHNPYDGHETCTPADALLLQLTEMLARVGPLASNPTVLHQFRQQMLLNFAQSLSNKSTTGPTRTDLRKTTSEPDLVETNFPWSLRLVSHLINQSTGAHIPGGVPESNNSTTENCWNSAAQSSTGVTDTTAAVVASSTSAKTTTTTAVADTKPTTTATATTTPSRWSPGQEHTGSSTTSTGLHHGLGLLANRNLPRGGLLEPLVEPPFQSDQPISPSGDRTVDASEEPCPDVKTPTPVPSPSAGVGWPPRKLIPDFPTKRIDLRGPLQSSTSVDSAFPESARNKAHLNTLGGSFHLVTDDSSPPRDGSPLSDTNNPQEVAMDWESDVSTAPSVPLPAGGDSSPSTSSAFAVPTGAAARDIRRPDVIEGQERIFDLWYGLPIEDWSTAATTSASTSPASSSPLPPQPSLSSCSSGPSNEVDLSLGLIATPTADSTALCLSSSPSAGLSSHSASDTPCQQPQPQQQQQPPLLPTAIAFDPEMLQHKCLCASAYDLAVHPESPARMGVALNRLMDARLHIPPHLPLTSLDLFAIVQASLANESAEVQRELNRYTGLDPCFWHALLNRVPLLGLCRLIRARMATEEELRIFHSEEHILSFGRASSNKRFSTQIESTPSPPTLELFYRSLANGRRKSDSSTKLAYSPRLCKLPCGGLGVDSDTVWNPGATARAARLATGQVLCLAHKVAKNELRNGFALVRPPGHHAEPGLAMGFCYFNSVAVAALHLLRNRLVSRLLILDWDIHHGNGTKLATLHPGLVYVSIHRHDGGTFFPGTGTVADRLIGAGASPAHSGDGHSSTRGTASSQLINIAWGASATPEGPAEDVQCCGDDSDADSCEAVLSSKQADMVVGKGAVDRRQMWRDYCSQRKYSDDSTHPIGGDEHTHGDQCVFAGPRAADSQHYQHRIHGSCRLTNTIDGGTSGGSSYACSLCRSHPSSSGSLSGSTAASAFRRVPFDDASPPGRQPTGTGAPHTGASARLTRTQSVDPVLGLSDAEYLAAVRCVVIPVANEFKPDMILISAGFDAAHGHPEQLGGYSVSPGAFAWITRQCMSVTNSRVVLALEGGYVPSVVSDCVTQCINALVLPGPRTPWHPTLSDPCVVKSSTNPSTVDPEGYMDAWLSASDWIAPSELSRPPRPEAVDSIMVTVEHQARQGWRCFANVSEDNVAMSFSEAMEYEQSLHGPRSTGMTNSVDLSSLRHADLDSTVCNSPLTDGLAQLHMDQC